MKAHVPLALLAGCIAGTADARRPAAAFEASGSNPGWQLDVGELFIGISFGPDGLPEGVTGQSYLIPRIRHRQHGGVLYWEAGKGVMAIVVEARPGDCTEAAGLVRSHRVVVRFKDRTLEGCGGVPAKRKRR